MSCRDSAVCHTYDVQVRTHRSARGVELLGGRLSNDGREQHGPRVVTQALPAVGYRVQMYCVCWQSPLVRFLES